MAILPDPITSNDHCQGQQQDLRLSFFLGVLEFKVILNLGLYI